MTGPLRTLLTRALTALLAGALLLGAGAVLAAPASAARPTPGSFSGYAFDARCAPTQEQMDVWLRHSPFWGVGVYVGGSTMACRAEAGDPASGQPHLDATWVRRQTSAGWRVLPIWVGPQAACSGYVDRIDPAPAGAYAAADAQGRAEAAAAVERVRALGIAERSTIWYDLEDFDLAGDDCRRSALRFLSAWTEELHRLGHRSGVYSNISAGIHALDNADNVSPGSYTMPDQVWYAWANGRADTTFSDKVRSGSWAGERVHQYVLDERATYGGVTLTIDRNYLRVGGGTTAPRARKVCGGVQLDRAAYPTIGKGRRGPVVRAAQCLLRKSASYRGKMDGRYDADATRVVRRYQRIVGLPVSGRVDRRTWVSLLARGEAKFLKEGSAHDAVRRLQRALRASGATVPVSGVLDRTTSRAVATYQRRVGLPAVGVVAPTTFDALRKGRL